MEKYFIPYWNFESVKHGQIWAIRKWAGIIDSMSISINFLMSMKTLYPEQTIYGIQKNETIFLSVWKVYSRSHCKLASCTYRADKESNQLYSRPACSYFKNSSTWSIKGQKGLCCHRWQQPSQRDRKPFIPIPSERFWTSKGPLNQAIINYSNKKNAASSNQETLH